MKITWVNHASFIFEYDGIKLITDPWLEYTAFDNGWALLSKTKMQYEDFSQITHIWFSHEHPDHFSPPCLNKIPKAYKEKITVLFQNTTDRKVIEYCKKAGFGNIIEMETNKACALSGKVSCTCNPFSDGDSWLYIKTDTSSLLNINDCIVHNTESALKIKNCIGDVDVLFTQFGLANKIGNTKDVDQRMAEANEKLNRIKIQKDVFNPKVIVPFASYMYFCHDENRYMNAGIHKVDKIADFITNDLKTACVVLYPGEQWEVLAAYDNTHSIQQYLEDYAGIEKDESRYLKPNDTIKIEDIQEEAQVFKSKIISFDSKNQVYKLFPSYKIWVADYQKSYIFDFRNGLKEAHYQSTDCDISLGAEALWYSFKHLWGGDTLTINARFQMPERGNFRRARLYYKLALMANREEKNSIKNILTQMVRVSPLNKLFSKL
jgi:UDP-MurNAc hydroxylase